MPLQHLQPFSVFEANNVVRKNRFPNWHGRLRLFGRRGGRFLDVRESVIYRPDGGRQSTCTNLIVGGMGGYYLGGKLKDSGVNRLFSHFRDPSSRNAISV